MQNVLSILLPLWSYNNKRLSAINAETPKAVQDFATNGHIYEKQVRNALNSWESDGYKEDVEKIYAYIGNSTRNCPPVSNLNCPPKIIF